ncbi:MAG TPA: hypothetical protein VF082_12730 [Jiangellaceae bacterium]
MSSAGDQLVAGRIPGERINTAIRTAGSASVTTTETIIDTVTAALVSGRTYRITWDFAFTISVATDQHFARIREDNTTGTQLQGFRIAPGATASSYPCHKEAEYTAVSTGNKTFVGTFVRTSGTGNVSSLGAATNPQYLYVDYIRS